MTASLPPGEMLVLMRCEKCGWRFWAHADVSPNDSHTILIRSGPRIEKCDGRVQRWEAIST